MGDLVVTVTPLFGQLGSLEILYHSNSSEYLFNKFYLCNVFILLSFGCDIDLGIFSGSEDKMEEGTDNENQETIYKDAFQKLNLQKCTDESIKPEDYDICSEESSNNTCGKKGGK